MRFRTTGVLRILLGAGMFCAPAMGQEAGNRPAANPGRELVAGKCFQCHTDSMFRDGRMDRVAWEASIYRMIGRGGQYTTDEIKQMADYLGSEFGPHAKPAAPAR